MPFRSMNGRGGMVHKASPFPGRSETQLAGELGPGDVPAQLSIGYSGLLIDTACAQIFRQATRRWTQWSRSRINQNALGTGGFSPEQIDLVVLSHFHADQ